MVSKRRSQEATAAASPQKKTKDEEEKKQVIEEVEETAVEEQEGEDTEKLNDEENEEMEVVDEAKDDDTVEETKADDKTPKEKEYTIAMPEDIDGISEESLEKTVKALGRGKVAVLKYVDAIKRAYDIIATMFPGEIKGAQNKSLAVLQEFTEETKGVSRVKLSDETKKAFAYHVEVCKTGMPTLFEETAAVTESKEEPEETPVQKLFKKAPKLSVSKVNDVVNRGGKIMKEKKSLLNDLNDLNSKMQIVDNLLCIQLAEANPDEKRAWQFFQENADQIIELFPTLGVTELVILDFCKSVGQAVLEKMTICRKNWTSLGSQLKVKSPSVSNLVNGPLVTPDQLAANKSLSPVTAETRSTLLNVVSGINKKVDNNITGIYKSLMSKEDAESFNYIVNDLVVLIGKQQSKSLLPEEKLYIGYHLSKVRPYVSKISDLNMTKNVLEGNFAAHAGLSDDKRPEINKGVTSPRGSSFRGRGDGSRGGSFKRGSAVSSGYRGSVGGFRGSSGGFQKTFNHYGAY